jgi:hypothetical protein
VGEEQTNGEPVSTIPNVAAGDSDHSPTVRTYKKRLIVIIALVVFLLAAAVVFITQRHSQKPRVSMKTYFSYTGQDTDTLSGLESAKNISMGEIQKWQDKAYELVEAHGTVDVDASKVYAYLAVAQMDAAALSYNTHDTFAGSVASISKDVLCQFYQDSCNGLLVSNQDEYSKTLAVTVLAKVRQRIAEDDKGIKPSVLKTGAQYWYGPAPQIGISAASFKPWLVKSSSQFRAAPPFDLASPEQQKQLATVKKQLAGATNDQKAIVVKWAGGPGTRTPPGIWMTLADDYMQEKQVPLNKYIETRALTAMSIADSVSAVFDSKYFYQYPRPNMFDTSIITIMPTPNHPSYPAGHATISWSAATVLSRYLPENNQEWERLAKEASDSRTIGGIHFPIDNEAGTKLGTDVATEALKNWD